MLYDQSDYFPKLTNPEVRWPPGIKASFLLLLLQPLVCRHFLLLLLTSPPVTEEINIRETKVQNAKVATLTSSPPLTQHCFEYSQCPGAGKRRQHSASEAALTGRHRGSCFQKATSGHRKCQDDASHPPGCGSDPSHGPPLLPEVGGLGPLRTGTWLEAARLPGALPCFWKTALCSVSHDGAPVSFICKQTSNYLKDLRNHRDQMIHGYRTLTSSP